MASSDVVQDTFIKLHASPPNFAAANTYQTLAYLRKVLESVIKDKQRWFNRKKRDPGGPVRAFADVERSSQQLDEFVAAEGSSLSDAMHRCERMLFLCDALSRLPENQQTAIELHHLEGLSLAETAEEMELTKQAVAGLVRRGMKGLRDTFGDSDESDCL